MENFINDLILENSRIIHRNFEGRQTKFNREGDRSFSVVINPENVDELRAQGWRIKELPPRDDIEGSEPLYFIDVRVNMGSNKPPKIYLCTSRKKTLLDEDSVGTLDAAEIKMTDMVLHPYRWETASGATGVKAYLKELYVTIEEDVFADKYNSLGIDSDVSPF